MVKSAIESKIQDLRNELEEKEQSVMESSRRSPPTNLGDMEANCKITDKPLLIKSICVLTITVVLFFMSNFPQFQVDLMSNIMKDKLTNLINICFSSVSAGLL